MFKLLKNLKIALASNAMEGFEQTPEMENDCIKVLSGELTVEQLIEELLVGKWVMHFWWHKEIALLIDVNPKVWIKLISIEKMSPVLYRAHF